MARTTPLDYIADVADSMLQQGAGQLLTPPAKAHDGCFLLHRSKFTVQYTTLRAPMFSPKGSKRIVQFPTHYDEQGNPVQGPEQMMAQVRHEHHRRWVEQQETAKVLTRQQHRHFLQCLVSEAIKQRKQRNDGTPEFPSRWVALLRNDINTLLSDAQEKDYVIAVKEMTRQLGLFVPQQAPAWSHPVQSVPPPPPPTASVGRVVTRRQETTF